MAEFTPIWKFMAFCSVCEILVDCTSHEGNHEVISFNAFLPTSDPRPASIASATAWWNPEAIEGLTGATSDNKLITSLPILRTLRDNAASRGSVAMSTSADPNAVPSCIPSAHDASSGGRKNRRVCDFSIADPFWSRFDGSVRRICFVSKEMRSMWPRSGLVMDGERSW